ncbi:class I SAM-dependent methyltransferase [Micromonospora mirobrigensis]|uniref:Methyltransferase domain-containing protein n=1 Tax=Micromonospora mirobrigensis TaxID=262898 RepID=A0A1C4W5P4_9ACTN|nr:class I SAM-dependent methyltransferase [Micromonospora mirobrigensis]SCE91556.1 Methyltransferase domain-containing protein [Micromonospora mirobrigensis]
MIDEAYADETLAALYDALNPWGPGDDFHLRLVRDAGAVLDVGCGTGALLRRARELGHTGRLCGLDPAAAMLDRARVRTDVEWVLGDLAGAPWWGEFDLVVMTGHALQVLLTDDQVRAGLAAVRRILVPGGRFAFETRNPAARPWERWTPVHGVRVTGPDGAPVDVAHRVDRADGPVVAFTTTFTGPAWPAPRISRSSLRFLDAPTLDGFLAEAGLVVRDRHGDWDGSPPTATSPEIITVAERVDR